MKNKGVNLVTTKASPDKKLFGIICWILGFCTLGAIQTGCGFRLEPINWPVANQTLWFSGEVHGEVAAELNEALQVRGASIAESSNTADYLLFINQFKLFQRAAALDNAARILEYEIQGELDFRMGHKTEAWSHQDTVKASRFYIRSPDNPLSDSHEEEEVKSELRSYLIDRMIDIMSLVVTEKTKKDNAN